MSGAVPHRFAGQAVVVVGGSRIAAAVVARLTAEGAMIVHHQDAAALADPQVAVALFDDVVGRHGRMHRLVHVPEIVTRGPAAMADPTDWHAAMDGTALSTWNAVRLGAERMKAEGGSIVTVGGATAFVGVPGLSIASAAAGAIVALSRSLALEYTPSVRINCVPVGWIDGDPLGNWYVEADPNRLLAMDGSFTLADRLGTVEEVAGVVAFLLSDEASSLLGNYVFADGGYSVR